MTCNSYWRYMKAWYEFKFGAACV